MGLTLPSFLFYADSAALDGLRNLKGAEQMKTSDNQYERKAQYNSNRQTYVDENGNYVYLIS